MRRTVLLGLALLAWIGGAGAETAYVTDSLRLGLHTASDTSDRPFENLISGTALEVPARTPRSARQPPPDARDRWVNAVFIVTEKPAAARLLELHTEIATLQGAVAEAKAAQTAAEQELSRLRAELQSTTGSAETIEEAMLRLEAENRAHEARFEEYRHTLPLKWVIPALVLTLVAGFLAGLWWLDALIRRRHCGFRVY
jgi:hypothetical protein